jgi:small-conductance mechanosensitive channel
MKFLLLSQDERARVFHRTFDDLQVRFSSLQASDEATRASLAASEMAAAGLRAQLEAAAVQAAEQTSRVEAISSELGNAQSALIAERAQTSSLQTALSRVEGQLNSEVLLVGARDRQLRDLGMHCDALQEELNGYSRAAMGSELRETQTMRAELARLGQARFRAPVRPEACVPERDALQQCLGRGPATALSCRALVDAYSACALSAK